MFLGILVAVVSILFIGCQECADNEGSLNGRGDSSTYGRGAEDVGEGPREREMESVRPGSEDGGSPLDARTALQNTSSQDAFIPRDEENWLRLEGLPDNCVIERAVHPEDLPGPGWRACPDTRNCERLDLREDDSYEARRARPWWYEAEETPYYGIDYGYDSKHAFFGIFRKDDNKAVAAWRGPTPLNSFCTVTNIIVKEGLAAMAVATIDENGKGLAALFRGSLEEIGKTATPFTALQGAYVDGANHVSEIALSEEILVTHHAVGGQLLVFRDGQTKEVARIDGGIVQRPAVEGEDIFWESWGERVQLHRGSFDGPTEVLRAGSGFDVRGLAVSSTDIAWFEAAGERPSYSRVELWTSRYAKKGEPLALRRVTEVAEYSTSTYTENGFFAFPTEDGSLRIFELATGNSLVLTVPEEFAFGPAYKLCREDVVACVVRRDDPYTLCTLWRLDISQAEFK